MTTVPSPSLPLKLATGDEAGPTALVRLHAAGIVVLTPAELGSIRQADVLQRAALAAGERHTIADAAQNDLRMRAIGTLSEAARATGAVPEDATAAYLAHMANLPALRTHYEVLLQAANASANHLRGSIHQWIRSAAFRGRLVAALDRILDDAAGHARIMAAGRGFDYADPASVYRADKPIQSAFAALVPLADRHDQLRAAVAALWGTLPRNETFPDPDAPLQGAGVAWIADAGSFRWRYRPEGHPVQRLVSAVAARDAATIAATDAA